MERTKEETSNDKTTNNNNEDNKETEKTINYKNEIYPKKQYRYRRCGYRGSLDKDVWRAGGSSDQVLEKWNLLYKMIMK